jgi:DNA-directed RNA polymerase subunit RPC12/RpoP
MSVQSKNPQSAFISSDHGTPIRCPQCSGWAHLIRMAPAGSGQEQRTFECATCKQQTIVTVKR